jgi:hypothetical protein
VETGVTVSDQGGCIIDQAFSFNDGDHPAVQAKPFGDTGSGYCIRRETIAPRTNASGQENPGIRKCAATATDMVVKNTSEIARAEIGRISFLKSSQAVLEAASYNKVAKKTRKLFRARAQFRHERKHAKDHTGNQQEDGIGKTDLRGKDRQKQENSYNNYYDGKIFHCQR